MLQYPQQRLRRIVRFKKVFEEQQPQIPTAVKKVAITSLFDTGYYDRIGRVFMKTWSAETYLYEPGMNATGCAAIVSQQNSLFSYKGVVRCANIKYDINAKEFNKAFLAFVDRENLESTDFQPYSFYTYCVGVYRIKSFIREALEHPQILKVLRSRLQLCRIIGAPFDELHGIHPFTVLVAELFSNVYHQHFHIGINEIIPLDETIIRSLCLQPMEHYSTIHSQEVVKCYDDYQHKPNSVIQDEIKQADPSFEHIFNNYCCPVYGSFTRWVIEECYDKVFHYRNVMSLFYKRSRGIVHESLLSVFKYIPCEFEEHVSSFETSAVTRPLRSILFSCFFESYDTYMKTGKPQCEIDPICLNFVSVLTQETLAMYIVDFVNHVAKNKHIIPLLLIRTFVSVFCQNYKKNEYVIPLMDAYKILFDVLSMISEKDKRTYIAFHTRYMSIDRPFDMIYHYTINNITSYEQVVDIYGEEMYPNLDDVDAEISEKPIYEGDGCAIHRIINSPTMRTPYDIDFIFIRHARTMTVTIHQDNNNKK